MFPRGRVKGSRTERLKTARPTDGRPVAWRENRENPERSLRVMPVNAVVGLYKLDPCEKKTVFLVTASKVT